MASIALNGFMLAGLSRWLRVSVGHCCISISTGKLVKWPAFPVLVTSDKFRYRTQGATVNGDVTVGMPSAEISQTKRTRLKTQR